MEDSRQFVKRRRTPRRIFENQIGLLMEGKYILSRSFEVGEGGMLISIPEGFSQKSRLVVSFRLPEKPPIVILGEVIYKRKHSITGEALYGVAFVDLGFADKRIIRSYVAAKLRESEVAEVA